MRRAKIAEWLLGRVLTPERVAPMVGDLLEESWTRGSVWFWKNVLRTAGSYTWKEAWAAPRMTARIALLSLVTGWLFGVAVLTWAVVLNFPWGLPRILIFPVGYVAAPLFAGWDVSRRAGGRGLPFAAALVSIGLGCEAMKLIASSLQEYFFGQPWPNMEHPVLRLISWTLFVLVGSLLYRQPTSKLSNTIKLP